MPPQCLLFAVWVRYRIYRVIDRNQLTSLLTASAALRVISVMLSAKVAAAGPRNLPAQLPIARLTKELLDTGRVGVPRDLAMHGRSQISMPLSGRI